MIRSIIFITIVFSVIACNNPDNKKIEDEKRLEKERARKEMSYRDSMEIAYPSIWIDGGLPQRKDHQRQIVDRWYNFSFIIRGGSCTFTPDKDTDRHNKRTDSIMTARLGKGWYERFEKSVDSLYEIDELAIKITESDKYIRNFDKTTEEFNKEYEYYPNLTYTSHATNDDNIKIVTIEGYGVVYKKVGFVNYLRATVDLKKKKVINIDKTAYSLQ